MTLPVNTVYSEVRFSCLPEDHVDFGAFAVRAVRCADDLWAVTRFGMQLVWNFREYRWDPGGLRENLHDATWRRSHLRQYTACYDAAVRETPRVRVNGHSVEEALELFSE